MKMLRDSLVTALQIQTGCIELNNEKIKSDLKIIIEHGDWLDMISQLRAAQASIESNIKPGDIHGIGFSDGTYYGIKRNKGSIRVYQQN